MMLLYLSAAMMVSTAAIHSIAGEKMIVAPLLAGDHRVALHSRKRKVVRSAWHLTSLFMVITAVAVVWPRTPAGLVGVVGAFWLIVGVFSLISSRGKHVGWPTLSAAGICALVGAWG